MVLLNEATLQKRPLLSEDDDRRLAGWALGECVGAVGACDVGDCDVGDCDVGDCDVGTCVGECVGVVGAALGERVGGVGGRVHVMHPMLPETKSVGMMTTTATVVNRSSATNQLNLDPAIQRLDGPLPLKAVGSAASGILEPRV